MDRFDARRKSVEMLEASGLMVNIEDYDNKVGFSERANVPIEPRLSMQWFLKYPCVKEAADAVAGGDITFSPARWAKTYAHWLENIQDWCISPTALVGPSHPGLVPQRQGGRTQERPGAGCLRTGTGLPLRGNRTSPGPGQLDSGQRRNGHMVLLLAVAFLHHG